MRTKLVKRQSLPLSRCWGEFRKPLLRIRGFPIYNSTSMRTSARESCEEFWPHVVSNISYFCEASYSLSRILNDTMKAMLLFLFLAGTLSHPSQAIGKSPAMFCHVLSEFGLEGFHGCWRAETMKQFCMKIDLIFQRRENVLFLPSNMAAMTSHENALFVSLYNPSLKTTRSPTLPLKVAKIPKRSKASTKLAAVSVCWNTIKTVSFCHTISSLYEFKK